jgi:hypothetical protein
LEAPMRVKSFPVIPRRTSLEPEALAIQSNGTRSRRGASACTYMVIVCCGYDWDVAAREL